VAIQRAPAPVVAHRRDPDLDLNEQARMIATVIAKKIANDTQLKFG
jgi:hypothetical protein